MDEIRRVIHNGNNPYLADANNLVLLDATYADIIPVSLTNNDSWSSECSWTGYDILFTANITGTGPYNYYWYNNDVIVSTGSTTGSTITYTAQSGSIYVKVYKVGTYIYGKSNTISKSICSCVTFSISGSPPNFQTQPHITYHGVNKVLYAKWYGQINNGAFNYLGVENHTISWNPAGATGIRAIYSYIYGNLDGFCVNNTGSNTIYW